MGRIKKEIKAVLHMPESEHAIRQFEKKICDFYVAQVEQKLHSLPKEKKLEVLDIILSSYSKQAQYLSMPQTKAISISHSVYMSSSATCPFS